MSSQPFRLDNKVAFVTGGASGIGESVCRVLANAGASVIIADLNLSAAEKLAAELPAARAMECDITNPESVEKTFAAIEHLDILVNNAGVQTWKPLLELQESEWDHVIQTNLKGTFLCTQWAGRHMRDHGGGRIVNIGSGSNKLAFPNLVNYTASKGGIEMFTKVAAAELGPYGITVNCVAPGAIEIERTRLETADYATTWGALAPMRRVGQPADVASAVCYLASGEAEFITGQTLYIDGGLFTRAPWPYETG